MRRQTEAGFTVIEILTVIGIMAVMGAILFPVLMSGRENARMTACASNLHQVAIALRLYANDNDNEYPPNDVDIRDMLAQGQQSAWSALLPYTHDRNVFHCPDERSRFDKIIGYQYRVGLHEKITDPFVRPAPPGSGTVVAWCEQHTLRSGDSGWAIENGTEVGPIIVVREDGSTATIPSGQIESWAYQQGQWHQMSNDGLPCPQDAYCDLRFPGEQWPPENVP